MKERAWLDMAYHRVSGSFREGSRTGNLYSCLNQEAALFHSARSKRRRGTITANERSESGEADIVVGR